MDQVAVFWDFENCSVPSSFSGYEIVKRIREIAHQFGSIRLFKAYTQISEQTPRPITLRSELQSSGVSITDCPHSGYKNVADQMIITDMLTFAMDNPTNPSTTTIMILSGDRDFAYTLSVLRLRKYNVAIIAPSAFHSSLREQASHFFEWNSSILLKVEERSETKPAHSRVHTSSDTPMTVSGPSRVTAPLPHSSKPPGSPLLRASSITREDSKALYSPPADSPSVAHPTLRSPAAIHSSVMHAGSPVFGPLYDRENKEASGNLPAYSPVREEALLDSSTTDGIPDWLKTRAKVRSSNAEQSILPLSPFDTLPSPISTPVVQSATASAQSIPVRESILLPTLPNFLPRARIPPSPTPHSAEPSFPVLTSTAVGWGWANIHIDASVPPPSTPLSIDPAEPVGLVTNEPQPVSTHAQIRTTINVEPDKHHIPVSVPSPSSASKTMAMSLPQATTSSKPDPLQSSLSRPLSQAPSAEPSKSVISAAVPSMLSAPPSTATPKSNSTLTPAAPNPPLKAIPPYFLPLVQHLENLRLKGVPTPYRSEISLLLIKGDKQTYQRAGCNKFKDFTAKAEQMGLIRLGGREGDAWIGLHPDLHGRIEVKP